MVPKIGQTISHYKILEKLGAGGMGEVYLAEDSTLKRQVALKILPDSFSADPERLARFQREAQVLASLNHPNIAAIHGLEVEDAKPILVLELVEGETLAERIARGPLPLEDALEVCRQIAEGLESAHEQGIIHRDLKPANIKITPEGKVKILDFGLAKALVQEPEVVELSHSPTITENMTRDGVILGTASYMSPEQAKGNRVDKRSDVWAFGCLLYECLTGRRAFPGETISETIAAVLAREPDLNRLPEGTPGRVRDILRRCFKKDPHLRLHDIADARIDIDDPEPSAVGVPAPKDSRREWLLAGLAILGFSLAILALLFWSPWWLEQPRSLSLRLDVALPPEAPLAPAGSMQLGVGRPSLVLSRDGNKLVYVASVEDRSRLYLRDMVTGDVSYIPGTDNAHGPFFSPDGRWIGFFAENKLMKVDLSAGEPVPLADSSSQDHGAVWGEDGYIYFNFGLGRGISVVPASGGTIEALTTSGTHGWPEILPGGDLLLSLGAAWSSVGIIGRDEPTRPEVLMEDAAFCRYAASGHLLYATPGKLLALPFDLDKREILGPPVIIADDLRTETAGAAQFTLSPEGSLVYAAGEHALRSSFVWIDRQGERESLGMARRHYGAFSISRDQRYLAVTVTEMGQNHIWVRDLLRGTENRLTRGGSDSGPYWSPDGKFLAFSSRREGTLKSYLINPEGTQAALPAAGNQTVARPQGFTPDGKSLVVSDGRGRAFSLYPVPVEVDAAGDPVPNILAQTEERWSYLAISPDGRFIAYTSDESGRWEVYLRPLPGLGWKRQVSIRGGEEARWNQSGDELIYRWGSQWFGVDIRFTPEIELGQPRPLFEGPFVNVPGYSWDMSPDGERFLVLESPGQTRPITRLVVITNIFDRLRRLAPVDR